MKKMQASKFGRDIRVRKEEKKRKCKEKCWDITRIVLLSALLLSVVVSVPFFFIKYTWFNPDGKSCWVNDENEEATSFKTGIEGERNIAARWH